VAVDEPPADVPAAPAAGPALAYGPVVRAVLSVLLVLFVGAVVAWNLPQSEIRRRSVRVARPGLVTVGADQTWSVFAPDPRPRTIAFEARLTYADGSRGVFSYPSGHPWLGEYRRYRWQKWMESFIADGHSELWADAARWIAAERSGSGAARRVVHVDLVRRWYDLSPPGVSPGPRVWHEYRFYSWSPVAL
jgi:hypothetical protein